MKSIITLILVIVNLISFAQTGIGTASTQGSQHFARTVSFKKNGTASIETKISAHFIGQNFGGGIVFYLDADGKHGLISETQDQAANSNWYIAKESCTKRDYHSTGGKNYSDWRLPTKTELETMYQERNLVGSFANSGYWSSSEDDNSGFAWYQDFESGAKYFGEAYNSLSVRTVRTF